MEEAKVIELKKQELKPCLAFKPKKTSYCVHKYVEVDEEERIVNCTKCGAVIEPFDYVLSCAKEERALFWQIAEVKRELADLTSEYLRLDKDVKNLKSQKRRLA